MIIIVKKQNPKILAIKVASWLLIFLMFFFYYQHMSEKFKAQNEQLKQSLNLAKIKKTDNKAYKYEKTIYKEAIKIVTLLGQRNIDTIKVKRDKLYIICDYNTNIEPILIRYGVYAFVKHTQKNIKIAIDLNTILEKRYETQ